MEVSKHCIGVDKRLLPVKFHYFLFMAALACALPFRTVFAKQLGISATAIGVIFCAIPFIKIVTNPLFGFVLDYFKRFRMTLSVIMIFVALSHVAMIFIPSKTRMPNNIINMTEKDFQSTITYFCLNETLPYDWDHNLIMYNEYNLTDKSETERNSFTCDVECSESKNAMIVKYEEHTQQCNQKMSFEIKIFIDISKCDMDVRLGSGKILVKDKDSRNPIFVKINESLITDVKSWAVPSENCSLELLSHSDIHSEKNQSLEEETFSEQNLLEKKYISGVLNVKSNASIIEPQNVIYKNNKQYYSLHKYKIKLLTENDSISRPCKLEFNCQTKKCYSDVHKDDFISAKFMSTENEFLSAQFWVLFFLISLSSVLLSAVMFMIDAVCYEMLQEKKAKYGQQRLWGTVGWGVGALAGGYLNQVLTADSGEVDYAPNFYLLTFIILIDLIPMYKLKVTEFKYSPHIWKDVCFLFTNMNILYNIIIVYFIGVLSGFIWNYQFWFMEEIGSSQVLLGLSQTVECVFELPWFLLSGWIIKKIGHDHCNNVTFLCFALRYLCFVFMYNPWWTLAAALFHGPTFGLFYASMTMYAEKEAPPGTEATVQSLLHLSFEGIGVATGSVLGGIGLDNFGSRTSFMYAAQISFLFLFVNVFMGIIFTRTKSSSMNIPDSHSCP